MGKEAPTKHYSGELSFVEPAGFEPVDIGIPEPRYKSWRWFVTSVQWKPLGGTASGGLLTVDLEEAIPAKSVRVAKEVRISIRAPLSYRVQDEGDMVPYWHFRSKEGSDVADFYKLAKSAYLDEIRGMQLIPERGAEHFLILGGNECVEVIGDEDTEFEVKIVNEGS